MLVATYVSPVRAFELTKRADFLHNPHSPDVFADEVAGIFTFNDCMRITFVSGRTDYSDTQARVESVVIGRLVMPVTAAENMANFILKQIADAKKAPDDAAIN